MSDFWTAFMRPLFPAVAVASFTSLGGARWPYVVAAGMGLYLTFLEIARQGGWK